VLRQVPGEEERVGSLRQVVKERGERVGRVDGDVEVSDGGDAD
jgi:hypothetical protein